MNLGLQLWPINIFLCFRFREEKQFLYQTPHTCGICGLGYRNINVYVTQIHLPLGSDERLNATPRCKWEIIQRPSGQLRFMWKTETPSFIHRGLLRSTEREKCKSKSFYRTNWVLTVFLDCCCSKPSHKCHMAEWYISVHKYHTSKWQLFLSLRGSL